MKPTSYSYSQDRTRAQRDAIFDMEAVSLLSKAITQLIDGNVMNAVTAIDRANNIIRVTHNNILNGEDDD